MRLRGPVVCMGYTDPAVNAEAFDAEGWFRTGDLGVLRPDGHLRLTGRLKDVIIRKGENISARELEDVLFNHPKVGDVAVIGVPDEERGELVVRRRRDRCGVRADHASTRWSRGARDAGLMRQKIPERLEIVDALPRNETLNKVLKFKLREQFGELAVTDEDVGAQDREQSGGVLTLTLNRPDVHNALDWKAREALVAALRRGERRPRRPCRRADRSRRPGVLHRRRPAGPDAERRRSLRVRPTRRRVTSRAASRTAGSAS